MTTWKKSEKVCESFDDLSENLAAHPSKAQVIVEVETRGNNLEKALGVLAEGGMSPAHRQIGEIDGTACVLLLLPSEDMKEAVLKLTEAGFTRVKGINAESHYPGKGSAFRISPNNR